VIADDAPLAAQVLWDLLLLVVIAVVVPLVLFRAVRLIKAARAIRTHFETTLTAAAGIVANTAPTTPALDQTIEVAGGILAVAADLDAHSGAIENLLTQRAATGSAR
jgi:hypothetical protein